MSGVKFDYSEAFRINSGILSPEQQNKLRHARITVVGTGGAGGVIAIMLARSGIGNYTLVDFDTYSMSNLNRQIGCFMDTIGQYKCEVIKSEILRINPEANVTTVTRKLSMEDLDKLLDDTDVYFSEAADLAYSNCSLVLAQRKKKMAVCYMPSGMTGYVMSFPPGLKKIVDPTDLFGGPRGLCYDDQAKFQKNPDYRKGRRWHVTQGNMRAEWFKRWCSGEETLTQLCPSVWLGASLAAMEAVKYLTGKWKVVGAPKIWRVELAENRVVARKFRQRTRLFSKFIYWAVNIKAFGIGERIRKNSIASVDKDLACMEKQEACGKCAKQPFMWRHII
jgi:molybdopterin/thiamine biosynthesis adenylyltransferase